MRVDLEYDNYLIARIKKNLSDGFISGEFIELLIIEYKKAFDEIKDLRERLGLENE